MIFARKMREIADIAKARKDGELRTALWSVYCDIESEIEEKIKAAAENGLYNISTGDLYDKIKPYEIEQRLIADGYNSTDIAHRLVDMVAKQFRECGFNVEIGRPTDNDCYCVYITWDKGSQ